MQRVRCLAHILASCEGIRLIHIKLHRVLDSGWGDWAMRISMHDFVTRFLLSSAWTTSPYLPWIIHRLAWNPHTRLKRSHVYRRFKLVLRLLDTCSKLSSTLRLHIYNTILKPAWSYRIEILGFHKTLKLLPTRIPPIENP